MKYIFSLLVTSLFTVSSIHLFWNFKLLPDNITLNDGYAYAGIASIVFGCLIFSGNKSSTSSSDQTNSLRVTITFITVGVFNLGISYLITLR